MKKRILAVGGIVLGSCVALTVLFLIVLSVSEYKPLPEETVEIQAGDRAQKAVSKGDRLEILSLNIAYAGLDAEMDLKTAGGEKNLPLSEGRVRQNLEEMIGLLKKSAADVILLQEVDTHSRRSYRIDEREEVRAALGMTSAYAQDYRCLFVPFPLTEATGEVSSGLQTLTDLTIKEARRIALPSSDAWPARIFLPKSCLLVSRIPVEDSGRELILVNLNLEFYANERLNELQAQAVTSFLEGEYAAGNYVVAGGDFGGLLPETQKPAHLPGERSGMVPGRLHKTLPPEGWTLAADVTTPSSRSLAKPYTTFGVNQFLYTDGFILSPNIIGEGVTTMDMGFKHTNHNPVLLSLRLAD